MGPEKISLISKFLLYLGYTVTARLDFELAYDDVAIQHIRKYATGNPTSLPFKEIII